MTTTQLAHLKELNNLDLDDEDMTTTQLAHLKELMAALDNLSDSERSILSGNYNYFVWGASLALVAVNHSIGGLSRDIHNRIHFVPTIKALDCNPNAAIKTVFGEKFHHVFYGGANYNHIPETLEDAEKTLKDLINYYDIKLNPKDALTTKVYNNILKETFHGWLRFI